MKGVSKGGKSWRRIFKEGLMGRMRGHDDVRL